MAEKNWLIRTKNKQILGPATKQKIIELIQKGSLTGEDEITSGNGYWFWVREEDLLDKYVYGDMKQSFNPISEAPDVLTAGGRMAAIEPFLATPVPVKKPQAPPVQKTNPSPASTVDSEGEVIYPDSSDLEYPDMGEMQASSSIEEEDIDLEVDMDHDEVEDITRLDLSDLSGQIAQMKASGQGQLRESPESYEESDPESENYGNYENYEDEHFPSDEDLEYPDMGDDSSSFHKNQEIEDDTLEVATVAKKSRPAAPAPKPKAPPKSVRPKKKKAFTLDEEDEEDEVIEEKISAAPVKQRNDKYLFFILVLIVALIMALFYYYKMVLNKPLPLVGISSAYAQSIAPLGKKKAFLILKI